MSRLHRSPWLITGVALLARLAFILGMHLGLLSTSSFWSSGVEMGWLANSLVASGQFASPLGVPSGPTAYIAPGYPLLLAGLFEAFGAFSPAAAWCILFLQALFSAMECAVIFYIGKKTFGEDAGVIGAWIWAVYPHCLMMPGLMLWETTASVLLLSLGFLLALTLAESGRTRDWLAFGLLWGISVLVNTSLLLVFAVALAWAWHRNPRRRGIQVRWVAAALVGFALLVGPWVARNFAVFHKFIPVRDNFGYELWLGNRPQASGFFKYSLHLARDPRALQEYRSLGELAYFGQKQKLAMDFIRRNPGSFARLCAKRFFAFWTGAEESGVSWLSLPLVVLGMFGLVVVLRRRRSEALLFCLPLLVYPLPFYLTHPDLRFRHLLEPMLILMGSYGVVQLSRGKVEQKAFLLHADVKSGAKAEVDVLALK